MTESKNFSFYVKKKKMSTDPIYYYKTPVLIVYIVSSIRSIHINISDENGVLQTFSTGKLGYKKKDRYLLTSIYDLVQKVILVLRKFKRIKKKSFIVLKGFGFKRNRVAKIFIKYLKPDGVIDLSGLPYNGCRPKKLRRK